MKVVYLPHWMTTTEVLNWIDGQGLVPVNEDEFVDYVKSNKESLRNSFVLALGVENDKDRPVPQYDHFFNSEGKMSYGKYHQQHVTGTGFVVKDK